MPINNMPFYELSERVRSGAIPVDFGGHFNSKADNKEFDRVHVRMIFTDDPEADAKQVEKLQFILDNPDAPPLEVPIDFRPSCLFECHECATDVELSTDGKKVWCRNPCKYPHGIGEFVFELNIPSGRMAVANDLRHYFPIVGDFNVNTNVGLLKTTMKYAEVGMAHAFVGNTCPSVYKVRKNNTKFLIGTSAYDDRKAPGRNSVRVAGVCTDLWWYSIADGDELDHRITEMSDRFRDGPDVEYVECKPGVYRFTHVYHMTDRDNYDKPQVYATIEWVRKPDPIVNYKAAYDALDMKAGQVILQNIRDWPTLYNKGGERTVESIQRAADSLMVVGGSGDEMHPNGWRGGNPELTNDNEDMEIPVFDKAYHWYPLSEYSFIVNAGGQGTNLFGGSIPDYYLNESFTALAFNILHCIVKYGCIESSGRNDGPTNIKYAKLALKGMAARYPDRVPEYTKEVLDSLDDVEIKPVTLAKKKS